MRTHRRLEDTYRFPGFRPLATVRGVFGDPLVRILPLQRRGKKHSVGPVVVGIARFTTTSSAGFVTCPVATRGSTWRFPFGGCGVGRAGK